MAIRSLFQLSVCAGLASCSVLFEATPAGTDGGAEVDAAEETTVDAGIMGHILFEDGFETGLGLWDVWIGGGGEVTLDTQGPLEGVRSARCLTQNAGGTQAALHVNLASSNTRSDIYFRAWLYLGEGFPATGAVGIMGLWHEGALTSHLWMDPDGKLAFKNEAGGEFKSVSYPIPLDSWVKFEILMDTSASGRANLRIDDQDVMNLAVTFPSDTPMDAINVGALYQAEDTKSYEVYVDDVLVMDQLGP